MPEPDHESTPATPVEQQPTAAPVETPIPVVKLDPGYLEHGASPDGVETRGS
jgi:hypothetical protein